MRTHTQTSTTDSEMSSNTIKHKNNSQCSNNVQCRAIHIAKKNGVEKIQRVFFRSSATKMVVQLISIWRRKAWTQIQKLVIEYVAREHHLLLEELCECDKCVEIR